MGLFTNFFNDLLPDKQAEKQEEQRIETEFKYYQAKGQMAAADWWDNMNQKMRQMKIDADREYYAMVEKRTEDAWHRVRVRARMKMTLSRVSNCCYLPPHKAEIECMYFKKNQKLHMCNVNDLMIPHPISFQIMTTAK